MTPRELVNVSQAAQRLDRPRTTVSGWVRDELVFRVGLADDGTPLYDLAALRLLDEAAPRRRRRPKRPTSAQIRKDEQHG